MRPEFAPTAQEEAEKINAQTGIGLVTEPEFWAKQGIYTGEELALSILHQENSDTYKALHGIRPRFKSFDTVDQVQDALDDLDREYEAMEAQAKLDAAVEADFQAEREELASLQVPGLDLDFEKKPMRSGMGRRAEGRKVKITRSQLKRMIMESVGAEKMHRCFDGSLVPFGSNECLEDLYQRKDDAQAVRDECSIRTDKRDYYNGVLKVLRRDIRDAEKENVRLNPAPKIEKL